jgi:8-oxo-dGTP diphosphatase
VADDPLDRSRAYIAAGVLFFGETPAHAAAREVREELGIETPVGPLLVMDWAPHPDEGDKLLFIFDGGILTAEQLAAIHLQADELASHSVHDPAEITTLLIPRLARRVAAAVDARQTGCPAYLEHGVPHTR